jgi:hypothetical protein
MLNSEIAILRLMYTSGKNTNDTKWRVKAHHSCCFRKGEK